MSSKEEYCHKKLVIRHNSPELRANRAKHEKNRIIRSNQLVDLQQELWNILGDVVDNDISIGPDLEEMLDKYKVSLIECLSGLTDHVSVWGEEEDTESTLDDGEQE